MTLVFATVFGRIYEPIPKKVLVAGGLVTVVLFGQVLFLGQVLLPLDTLRRFTPFQDLPPTQPKGFHLQIDQLEDMAPYMAQVRRVVGRGEWPLLNDLVGAGEPLLVNLQAQPFQPFVLLAYPFPMHAALGIIAALKVLTALIFTFLLLRRLGLSEPPALAAGLGYALGGFLLLYLGWPHTQAAAFLPLLLYSIERVARTGAAAGHVLAGRGRSRPALRRPPGNHALRGGDRCRLPGLPAGDVGSSRGAETAVQTALAAAVAGALAAPVLLPAAIYLEHTARYETVEARAERNPGPVAEIQQKLARPESREKELENLKKRSVPLVAPTAFGSNRHGHYWGATTVFQDSSSFAGNALVLALLIGLLPRRGRKRTGAERFFFWTGAVCLVVVLQPTGLKGLFTSIPVLSQSASYHRRLTMVLCFCLAVLAAFAWERWRREGEERRRVLLMTALLARWCSGPTSAIRIPRTPRPSSSSASSSSPPTSWRSSERP